MYDRNGVDITPMSFIPGGRIEKYLGNLNFFFIRESTSVRENGGISGFVHGFITEVCHVLNNLVILVLDPGKISGFVFCHIRYWR